MFAEHSGAGAAVVVLTLALLPAAMRCWWGRALAGLGDDPLIAERLHAHNSRVGLLFFACLCAVCLGWPRWTIWSVPLLFSAQSIAAYPLRRALYAETWTLAASLSFYGRLALAVFGFWGLLGAAPWIAAAAGQSDWIAAGATAVVLIAWDWYFADVLRALLNCEPITDAVLLDRFERLVKTSGIPAPRFEYIRMRGGVLANALALGSLRHSSVIFTDTLLSRLSTDETVAICAHELAHLEYYNAARLRRIQASNWILIAIVCLVTPVSRSLFGPDPTRIPAALCSVAVPVALALRGRYRQRNETASDVRAVQLTGDPDALARALTALHAIAKVPRRWDRQREEQATHPSLARRIRDIRAAAGTAAPPAMEAVATFNAARGDASVTFDTAQLHWRDAPGSTHLLDYGMLRELRLDVSPMGVVSLTALEQRGRRWTMTTRPEDAAALQSVLDIVDGRLGSPMAAAAISAPVVRFAAAFVCGVAAMLGQFAFGLVAVLAAFVPVPAILNATGMAALVSAAVLLTQRSGDLLPHAGTAAILALLGVGSFAMAYSRRAEAVQPANFAVVALAVAAVVATIGIALGGFDAVRLHQGARDLTAAPVLLVALAAACWNWRSRPQFRYAALGAAVIGLAAVGIGSTAFLEAVGRDPFLVDAPPIRWARIDAEPAASFDVPFEIESLRVSPQGALAAVVRAEPDNARAAAAPALFHIRQRDGSLTALEGSDIAFLDDRRILLLTLGAAGAELQVRPFDGAPAPRWRERIPGLRRGSLTYDAAQNRWSLVGRDADGAVLRATGVVGVEGFELATWKGLAERDGWISAIGTRGDAALAIEKSYGYGLLGAGVVMRMPSALMYSYPESRLWRLRGDARVDAGRSLLDVACSSEPLRDGSVPCTAFDGRRTRVLSVDPATAAVTPVGMFDGAFYADRSGAPGWLSGWWRSRVAAINLTMRLGFRLPRHPREYVTLVAPAEGVIGTATSVEGGTRVRIYALPTTPAALTRAE